MTYQEHSIHNPFTAEEKERGLMAMIAWAGNAAAAARMLKAEGLDINHSTLNGWKHSNAIRYDELREKHSASMEASLAHEMRDVAALASQATRLAIQKATDKLEANREDDPARAAANLARVSQSATDKLMTLTSRPVQITETRNVGEILRSLAAKGVIQIPVEAESVESEPADG